MDKQNTCRNCGERGGEFRDPSKLYEHEAHCHGTTTTPPAGQVEAVASDLLRLAHNADNHTIASLKQHLFVIHKHLEQSIIKASGAEHIAGLGNRNAILERENQSLRQQHRAMYDELMWYKQNVPPHLYPPLPPELRGK